MFGLPFLPSQIYVALFALSPAEKWAALRDQHIGMAIQKEATKQENWKVMGDPKSFAFDLKAGKLRIGPAAAYDVQVLGVEDGDSFTWTWAMTDSSEPPIPAPLVCHALKELPSLMDFPEFSIAESIPLSTTHNGEIFAEVAVSALGDKCRTVYQYPNYTTGLIYYLLIIDSSFPLDNQRSVCERLASVTERMVQPQSEHRITNIKAAFTNYALALGMTTQPNAEGTQIKASPTQPSKGSVHDLVQIDFDPKFNVVTTISGRWNNAKHTTTIEYDDQGMFADIFSQPSVDLSDDVMFNAANGDASVTGQM